MDEKFYGTMMIDLININNEKVSTAILFLDVTKEKLEYISLIRNGLITSILLFLIAAIIVNYFINFLVKKINKNEEQLKEIN